MVEDVLEIEELSRNRDIFGQGELTEELAHLLKMFSDRESGNRYLHLALEVGFVNEAAFAVDFVYLLCRYQVYLPIFKGSQDVDVEGHVVQLLHLSKKKILDQPVQVRIFVSVNLLFQVFYLLLKSILAYLLEHHLDLLFIFFLNSPRDFLVLQHICQIYLLNTD